VGYKAGQRAPDFMLTTVGGENLTLDSFRGRPVILYFFATW
jgi:peroxiredoxin